MLGHSTAWLSGWAKSYFDRETSQVTHWLPLFQHLEDSAAVARRLVADWVPRQVVHRIGAALPGGDDDVGTLAAWLAGVHDVGKLSPAFVVQAPRLADRMRRDHLLDADPALEHSPARSSVNHSLVGHVAVRDWLVAELDLPRRGAATQLASVVGSHHGISPERATLSRVTDFPHLAGTGVWQEARADALSHITGSVDSVDVLRKLRDTRLDSPSLVLLSAIVVVADWIASNTALFPLEPVSTAEYLTEPDPERTRHRLDRAWRRLDLPTRWSPPPGADVDSQFRERFPHIERPRPVQRAVAETARGLSEPGLMIVEAPMGVGKTEAALVAAEDLARTFGSGGVFVALPTQATSDAMFARVADWLRALPRDDDAPPVDVTLAHGKASLNDTFDGLVREGEFACVGEDSADSIAVHQWLQGNKKGPLAAFVVGTIDQVLVAGLKSRHLMLRHLALAGKVVVIDEVHAYDVYMSQYLHRVLHWLGAYGVPVVLLSATLPAARRAELVRAYAAGRGEVPEIPTRNDTAYPAVSTSADPVPHTVDVGEPPTEVGIDRLPDDLDALVRYLREALAEGGCAAVVRNTVDRVQETADRLGEEFGSDRVTVNHSRFLACDRARIDTDLVRRFGPPGPDNDRAGPHIVVASQVLEQSLDVDFDLLVTDLAPVDLVLQRLGRTHRHRRERPAPVWAPRCAVVGVQDWHGTPVRAVRGSRAVYGEYPLLRSAALLVERDTVRLPDDIAPLVQAGYGDEPIGDPSWHPALTAAAEAADAKARERRHKAATFLLDEAAAGASLIGWVQAGVGDAEGPHGAAQVRDGAESLEVLVVQRDRDGGLLTPDWIAEGAATQIPLDDVVPPDLARIVAACSLRLPFAMSHEGVIDEVIRVVEDESRFTAFDQTPLLAGQLVLALDQQRRATVCAGQHEFRLTYDTRRGLIHERD